MLAKRIAIAFGIAVIFPMLVHYGVSMFVPRPRWEPPPPAAPGESRDERNARLAEQRSLQAEHRAEEKRFERHLFAFAVPLGVAAILAGAFLRLPAIGSGLMFGGILSVCDGYANYWGELADALKFASLLAAFVVLVVVGWRRLERPGPPG